MNPQNHMAPVIALARSLHKGRSLEERFRVMRAKREGMRRSLGVSVSGAEAEALTVGLGPCLRKYERKHSNGSGKSAGAQSR